MLELIAQGPNLDTRWRRPLGPEEFELGRLTPTHRVPWDAQISRRHVILKVDGSQLKVEKIDGASNPVFFNGDERESFVVSPGEHFVIGSTTFTFAADKAFATLDAPNPISQRTFSPEFLKKVVYRDADRRVDILNRLPDAISSAGNTQELLIQMVNMLMSGINLATTVAIVRLDELEAEKKESHEIEIVHWDRRGIEGGDFQPSGTLIRQSIASSESVLHIWHQNKVTSSEYTVDYENDWAFVCPITSVASPGWGIYVAGKNRGGSSSANSDREEPDLQGDIKFAELIGATLKNLLIVKKFERQTSSLRSFFAPVVMKAISTQDPDEVLAPRLCDVSVLFCDLRGFSKTSEELSGQLFELLNRVNESLSIVTRCVLDHGGVIGDFHGDSAMGFWGWPLASSSKETALASVAAALEIQATFQNGLQQDKKLAGFQVGIGIASGEAVAGKIGSRDQVKVTAFGPVVNLAARIEGMTRLVSSGILVDLETAKRLEGADWTSVQVPEPAIRRLGKFQPFGMEKVVELFQLADAEKLAQTRVADYESALHLFEAGGWEAAAKAFALLSDEAASYLIKFMKKLSNQPPSDWIGVVPLESK